MGSRDRFNVPWTNERDHSARPERTFAEWSRTALKISGQVALVTRAGTGVDRAAAVARRSCNGPRCLTKGP